MRFNEGDEIVYAAHFIEGSIHAACLFVRYFDKEDKIVFDAFHTRSADCWVILEGSETKVDGISTEMWFRKGRHVLTEITRCDLETVIW